MNRFTITLAAFILIAMHSLYAQKDNIFSINQFDPRQHVRASNAAIAVVVDKLSGRFFIERIDGLPILFTRNNGMTSFTNILMNDKVYTNNTLNGPQSPWGTITMPVGNAIAQNDRVIYSTDITNRYGRVTLTQEFIPSLDQDYAYVRIVTTVTNQSNIPLSIGSLLMMDLMIGFEDYVRVSINGNTLTNETGYYNQSIPDEWFGSSSIIPVQVKARLRGNGTTPPNQFVVGRWQYDGYLGAAAWDYVPSGLRMGDNAVLMQWNDEVVQPGASRSVITDHGYIAKYSARISCSVDAIRYNESIGNYDPNPFKLQTVITNTGDIDINNMTLELDPLPNNISYAPSETKQKNIAGPISSGKTTSVEWSLVAVDFQTTTTVPFIVRIISPSKLIDSCKTQTTIPFAPKYIASLDCGNPITLQLDPSKHRYQNNPFPIIVTIKNTGNVSLDNLSATITLPPRLQLSMGGPTIPILPNPLFPSQTTSVAWDVIALTDTVDATQSFTVTLTGPHKINVQCSQQVTIPAIVIETHCIENGLSTKGTEFWFAFPPNTQGNSGPTLNLFFAADEATKVTIERPGISATTTMIVQPNLISEFRLEDILNDALPERVQNLGVHITADHPVAVYFANLRDRHSDATMILPMHALGKSYVSVGYNWTDAEEHFIICATEDVTRITIVPSAGTSGGRPPGVPINIALNKGQTYYLYSELGGKYGGLTGSIITADKPIAIIGGGESGHIPYPNPTDYGFLNPHFDQFIPDNLLGTEYITVPFRSRLRGDTFKFVATQDNTTFMIDNGAPITLTLRGDQYETILQTASHIQSDKPILVAQFANSAEYDAPDNEYGDGSMVILSPIDRFVTCHAFPTGLGNRYDSSFVNIVVPDGVQKTITLDNGAVSDTAFHSVPNTTFLYAQLLLNPGMHRIETSDNRGVGVIVYGFEFHDAFTFNSGFLIQKKVKLTDVEKDKFENGFMIDQVIPNPFVMKTNIQFSLPSSGNVMLKIYDVLGKEVETLVNEYREAGKHSVDWNAMNKPNGMYLCRLTMNHNSVTKMIVLMK